MKPLLSATLEDPSKLPFPVAVSPKLDGLRCLIQDGVALSRNLKPFRNLHVQQLLCGLPTGLDGELVVGEPNRGHVLNRTQSGIMSAEGTPEFTYWAFDNFENPQLPFTQRFNSLVNVSHPNVKIVPHQAVTNLKVLLEFERAVLADGYEGIMVRGLTGAYKFGRATNNEAILWKFKRFRDSEAVVEQLLEGVTNQNEATVDALGHTKRSTHQENMVGSSQVGTIIARDLETGQLLQVSPGRMTKDLREYYWHNPHKLLGEIITVKWFEYGVKDAPRFCTFQNMRPPE